MAGLSGPLPVLAVAVAAAFVLSGCVAVGGKDDQGTVLARFSRESATSGDEVKPFNVGKDVKSIRLAFSTKPVKDTKEEIPGCSWCNDWDDDDDETVAGSVRFTVLKPDEKPADWATLPYGSSDESMIPNPQQGTWYVAVEYLGGYDGPAAMSVSDPNTGSTNAGGVLFSQAWLDIAGLALAVLTLVGGWLLLRRRSKFLASELHRIDDAFRTKAEDVDECRENLIEMREDLRDMLTARKIEDRQYIILERRIDQYLHDLDEPGNRRAAPKKRVGVEKIRQA